MADTSQGVSWALERACKLRTGGEWVLPSRTLERLSVLETIARAERDHRIVDGICVTGWTTANDKAGEHHDIPYSGFRVDETLKEYGKLESVVSTCGPCEANVASDAPVKVAGCFGHLNLWPDCPELEDALRRVVVSRGLEDRLHKAFPATTPLWYGFWIESPLRRLQTELLLELFEAAFNEHNREDEDVSQFIAALQAAVQWELPLHVSLAPLGHTDFGWYTVFPHCPRCKANAPVGRWRERYPTEEYKCHVCDHPFVPEENHSSEQYEFDDNSLEKQLGQPAYATFTKRFLQFRGCTERQAEEVVDIHKNGPLLRQVGKMRRKRRATIRQIRESRRPPDVTPNSLTLSLPDKVSLECVLVPAGEFLMGSSGANPDHGQIEMPQHGVTMHHAFYMGRFPVTQAQWQAVMGTCPTRSNEGPDLPIDRVSWLDCQEFCQKLSKSLRRVIRLPTEAEWEYACRAGTMTEFAFGDLLTPDQANCASLRSPSDLLTLTQKGRTSPVGTYLPNAWGLYDMHGNASEWTEDVWHDSYEGAPSDGSAWLEGEEGEAFRVVRGGWCSASATVCRSAARRQLRADANSDDDEIELGDDFLSEVLADLWEPVGFRVVCEV